MMLITTAILTGLRPERYLNSIKAPTTAQPTPKSVRRGFQRATIIMGAQYFSLIITPPQTRLTTGKPIITRRNLKALQPKQARQARQFAARTWTAARG